MNGKTKEKQPRAEYVYRKSETGGAEPTCSRCGHKVPTTMRPTTCPNCGALLIPEENR